jgi:hypothetical protein
MDNLFSDPMRAHRVTHRQFPAKHG